MAHHPCGDFSTAAHFGAAVIHLCSSPQVCLPLRSLLPQDTTYPGQPWRFHPSLSRFVTSPCPGYARRPHRAIDGRGLSPLKIRSLVGCSPNAGAQPRLKAEARQLGKRKARSLSRFLTLPVENRTCHFYGIRLSTFDCSPWGDHEASVPISPVPQVSTRVQLARSLGTFVSLFSKARGLRRQSSSWCARLSRAQTTMPHPTLPSGIEHS